MFVAYNLKLKSLLCLEALAVLLLIVTVALYYIFVKVDTKPFVLPEGFGNESLDPIQSIAYTPYGESVPAYVLEYIDHSNSWYLTHVGMLADSGILIDTNYSRSPILANGILVDKLLGVIQNLESEAIISSTPSDPTVVTDIITSAGIVSTDTGQTVDMMSGASLHLVTKSGLEVTLSFGSEIRTEESHFQGFMYLMVEGHTHIVTSQLYQIVPERAEQLASLNVYDITEGEVEFWAINVGNLEYSLVFAHDKSLINTSSAHVRSGSWILNSQQSLSSYESQKVFSKLLPLESFRVYSLNGEYPMGCSGSISNGDSNDALYGSMVMFSPQREVQGVTMPELEVVLPICNLGLFYYITGTTGFVYELDAYPFSELLLY